MAEIEVNTTKLRECGNDIMSIANSLENDINDLFDRINNMPVNTYEWTGEAAMAFAKRAKLEKQQYIELKNCLYKYGKYLVECSTNLENDIRSMKN